MTEQQPETTSSSAGVRGSERARLPSWLWKVGAFVLGFIGAALVLACILWVRTFGWPKWQHGFDADDWKAASCTSFSDDDRWFMIDDLLHNHTLKGLDQVQLEALLGPPDPEPYLLEEQPRHAGAHIYHLGPDHLALDSMWLVVKWDASQHVAEAVVVSD